MSNVYTTRFFAFGGATTTRSYTVPAGKRAVVKSISAVNNLGSSASAALQVGGVYAWYVTLPAATSSTSFETRQVAYAGETILCTTTGQDTRVHVAGFLFDDPATHLEAGQLPTEQPGSTPPGPPA